MRGTNHKVIISRKTRHPPFSWHVYERIVNARIFFLSFFFSFHWTNWFCPQNQFKWFSRESD